jgi:hypothetical protein
MCKSSNGHELTGTMAVAIRAGEARIPEGAEAWSQCGFQRRRQLADVCFRYEGNEDDEQQRYWMSGAGE